MLITFKCNYISYQIAKKLFGLIKFMYMFTPIYLYVRIKIIIYIYNIYFTQGTDLNLVSQ